jgi:hypothetical protein
MTTLMSPGMTKTPASERDSANLVRGRCSQLLSRARAESYKQLFCLGPLGSDGR